ncbi:hypothetical protein R50073_44220 [Maricurvus nonylphenolicus]|uniref:response regulator n=1 Tax=Maricurvus nonylphenolicus TaxID=1008307 RepID=UPI0036F34F60
MDVYLVEDQPSLSLTYSAMLTKLGYSAQTFSCPADFLDFMQSGRYQPPRLAILSDILMPGGSGYYLMSEVRKEYPQQKFIMLSATPMEEHADDFACMYFCKPVSLERLQAALALLEQCVMCGQQGLSEQCEQVDDRQVFPVEGWRCPNQSECGDDAPRV